jgi:peptidoglycan/xylan/chitin deacetylase (PgdA/CDA1 family)
VTVKATAKHIIYHSGGLSAYRRLRRNTLTILLLHRVLPQDDPRARTADPSYTLRLETFEGCLEAVRRWYDPVSLGDIENALRNQSKLPHNALLVTFDDGWEDTARYALPALQSRGIPGVVFVATGAIGNEHTPWRDIAACVWRAGVLSEPYSDSKNASSLEALWQWLDGLPEEQRIQWLNKATDDADESVRPLMMSRETLRRLAHEGVGLGGHGVSHTPLTKLADAESELRQCGVEFRELTGWLPTSFAFPHGLYTEFELKAAQASGFDLVFTSDRHLNPLRDGRPVSSVFGRISISEEDVTDSEGRFVPEKLAYWLTLQPVKNLA